MPAANIQSDKFEPLHDAHAIEQVSFAVQFDQPLDDPEMRAVCELAKRFETDLPGGGEIQGFSGIRFSIGQPAPSILPAGAPPTIGVVRTKTRPDGMVESELRAERQSVSFRTLLYTRWDMVWAQAGTFFRALLPPYATKSRIVGINLTYVDKFVSNAELENCHPAELLKAGSKYLAPHIFDMRDYWHSYTGAFIKVDSKTKRLLNLNADFVDDTSIHNSRRVVCITTVLTDMMNQPGYAPFEVTPATAADEMEAHMHQLHAFAKIVFGDIVGPEMSRRIALGE